MTLSQTLCAFPSHSSKVLNQSFNQSKPIHLSKVTETVKDLDIQSFMCPISLDKFVDPVVDKCGHTYSKVQIEQYCKMKSVDGKIFPCPLDPSTLINIDDMKKNYSLENAMDETNDIINKKEKTFEDRLSLIEKRLDANEELNKAYLKKIKRQKQISFEIDQQRKIQKKQLENLANMSIYDRVNTVFFYSHLDTVKNRGLKNYELNILKEQIALK